jgi:hypothetical protein
MTGENKTRGSSPADLERIRPAHLFNSEAEKL